MPRPEQFHLGIQYYRQPTPPPEEWERDLEHIRRLGFTAIQLRPQWAWHEREEGRYQWDDLDRLLELTEQYGLQVLFKFMLESAPRWLFRDYEALRVAPDGAPLPPRALGAFYLGGWWPCFDRPLVRQKAEGFVVGAIRRYRDRPQILGWHLWNEPRSRPFEDCACPDSIAQYRQWLAERFGTVEQYNQCYGQCIARWEDITPPADLGAYFDSCLWRRWRAEAIAGRIAWMAALVREHDPSRPLFCHVGFSSVLQPTLLDTCHDLPTARPVDVYGTSLPHWTGDFHSFYQLDRPALFSNPDYRQEAFLYSLQARWIAAVKDYFWVNEIYGNNWHYLGEPFSGDDTRFMLLGAVAEGARGLVIWQFKPERFAQETISSGLVGLDGADTDRSRAASQVGRALERSPEAFRTWKPESSPVALVFDFEADMHSEAEDAEELPRAGTVRYRYKESLKGWYSLLWQLGQAVDLVPVEELERIGRYRLVVLPYQHLLGEDQAAVLEGYVRGGGVLVSDPGLAFRDRRGWVRPQRPGCGLAELLCCREEAPRPLGQELAARVLGLPLAINGLAARLSRCPADRTVPAGRDCWWRAGAGRAGPSISAATRGSSTATPARRRCSPWPPGCWDRPGSRPGPPVRWCGCGAGQSGSSPGRRRSCSITRTPRRNCRRGA